LPKCSFLVVVDDVVEEPFNEELEEKEDEEYLGVRKVGIQDFVNELREVSWLGRGRENKNLTLIKKASSSSPKTGSTIWWLSFSWVPWEVTLCLGAKASWAFRGLTRVEDKRARSLR
jgi:hypothetical protein